MKQNNRVLIYCLFIFSFLLFSSCLVSAANIDTDSPQFAAVAETRVYRIKKNSGERIKEELSQKGVEIDILSEKNFLVIKALPEKMQEVEKQLKQIEETDRVFQVKYNLYVIELETRLVNQLGLKEAGLGLEEELHLYREDDLIEIIGDNFDSYLNFRAEDSTEDYRRVAEPVLITAVNSTASLALSEDVNYIDEDITDYEDSIEIEITPVNVVENEERIKTEVQFNGSNNINSALSTTIWTDYNSPELIGVVRDAQTKESSSTGNKKKEETDRYFAFYLAAQPVSVLPEPGRETFNLQGLDTLLFKQKERAKPKKEELRFIYNSYPEISVNLQAPAEKRGLVFNMEENKDNTGQLNLDLGPDFYLIEGLKLGTRFQIQDQESKLRVGLNERVEVSPYLSFSGGYYPWYYNITERNMTDESNWWVESEINYSSLFLNMKYNEYEDEEKETSWRSLLGWKISEPLSIMVGVEEDEDKDQKYLGGISLRSW